MPAYHKHVFSWDDFEPEVSFPKRFAQWRDVYASRYGVCDFAPPEEQPFHAQIEMRTIGTLGVVHFDSSMRFCRRAVRDVAIDGRDDVLIGINRAGAATGRYGGREIDVQPGNLTIYSYSEPLDLTFQGERLVATALSIPRYRLAEVIGNPEDSFGVFGGQSQAARHLLAYCGLLLHEDAPRGDPALDLRIETMLLDLVTLTIGATKDAVHIAQERGLRAARLLAIKADIRENMGRPGFSITSVAQRQGVSTRYVHILFEAEGKTFTEYVHEHRLKEAHRMLANPAYDDMRIGEIAHAVGFSEQSTFNRLFRQAFNATPSEVRWEARKER